MNKSKLVESLITSTIGIILMVKLMEAIITGMVAPIQNKINELEKIGTEYGMLLEEIGELDNVKGIK